MNELRKLLSRLLDETSPGKRGELFEQLLEEVFHLNHFEVVPNPGTANPRQTDLFARNSSLNILIEAKCHSRHIQVADVVQCRDRLSRSTPGLIGCLFTLTSYANTVAQEIESRRQTEILAFDGNDVLALVNGSSLEAMIETKRDALKIHGESLLGNTKAGKSISPAESDTKRPRSRLLPRPTRKLFMSGKYRKQLAWRNEQFSSLAFLPTIRDIGTGGQDSIEFSVDVRDRLSLAQFRHLLDEVQASFNFSTEATFTITQSGWQWFGFGVEECVSELARWRQRYRDVGLNRPHHSEELILADLFGRNLFSLTATHEVGKNDEIWHATISVIPKGIPLFTDPYKRLAKFAGDESACFSTNSYGRVSIVRPDTQIFLRPIAHLVEQREPRKERLVTGMVFENPYWHCSVPIPKIEEKCHGISLLSQCRYIVAELGQWHPLDDEVEQYYLREFRVLSTGDSTIFSFLADWTECRHTKARREQKHQAKPDRRALARALRAARVRQDSLLLKLKQFGERKD